MQRKADWLRSVTACFSMLVFASHVATGISAQAPTPDQQKLVDQLHSRTWSVRRSAVTVILAIPSPERSPTLVRAVVDEIKRLQRAPALGAAEVPAGHDIEAGWDYFTDLVQIACDSTDPIVIEPIVKALDMGNPVLDALARFGDAATPHVLAAIRSRHNDPGFLSIALIALQRTLDRHPELGQTSRVAITDLAREHLAGRQYTVVLMGAIDVAGSLRDKQFTPALQRIAEAKSAEEAGLILVGEWNFEDLRARARAALAKLQ